MRGQVGPAGIGAASAVLLLSVINDASILAFSVSKPAMATFVAAHMPPIGTTLPALLCVVFGALSHYGPSRAAQLGYLGSAGAGMLILAFNTAFRSQTSFISPQVAIASAILMVMIVYLGFEPTSPSSEDERPVQLSPYFTP